MTSPRAIAGVARQLESISYADLPDGVVHRLKDALLDFLGVALCGYGLGAGPLIAFGKETRQEPGSTLLGDGARVSTAAAAGVNAQLAYDTDFDEAGPGNHTFSIIAATALATAEQEGRDGRALLTALAVAYHLNGKFHRSLRGSANGIRHLPLNAAVSAGKLLGFDAARFEHAMELSWMLVPAELDMLFHGEWWRSIGQGSVLICNAGVQAARLAHRGVRGPLGALEAGGGYDFASLVRWDQPEPFHYILNEMHLKPWIGSRGTHAALQMIEETVATERIAPDAIESVEVLSRGIYTVAPFDCAVPQSWRDAASSIPWSVAMVILGVPAGPEWLTPARLRDPQALALAAKVVVKEEPTASAIWRSGQRTSPELINRIRLSAAGRVHERSLRVDDCLGSPRHPLKRDAVVAKFQRLAAPVIGTERAQEVARLVGVLERQATLEPLTLLLSRT